MKIFKNKEFVIFIFTFFIFVAVLISFALFGLDLIPSDNEAQKITSTAARHWYIVYSLIPTVSALLIYYAEVNWMFKIDINDSKYLPLIFWIVTALGIIVAGVLIPWKWLDPLITVLTIVITPLLLNIQRLRNYSNRSIRTRKSKKKTT